MHFTYLHVLAHTCLSVHVHTHNYALVDVHLHAFIYSFQRLQSLPNPPVPTPTPTQRRKAVSSSRLFSEKEQQFQLLVTNGIPPMSTCHPHSPPSLLTKPSPITSPPTIQSPDHSALHHSEAAAVVEIDVPSSIKGLKPLKLNSESEISSYVCLPSPLTSILGPRKTLHILNESAESVNSRPVRQVS